MIPKKYVASLKSVDALSDDVSYFTFNLGSSMLFEPGQFVMISMDIGGETVKRAYSIANSPESTEALSFCVKLLKDGKLSSALDKLETGDTVEIQGPYGNFLLSEPGLDQLFIAAGTGVAPLIPMLKSYLENNTCEVTLLFGFRHEKDFLFKKDLEKLTSSYANFKLVPIMSSPHEGWTGLSGHVTSYLADHINDIDRTISYVCGHNDMVVAVRKILIESGLSPERIKIDNWG
ncbi:TPA: FAD-dependent oxidoreductase [archaeon]|nr:FAD-dependent oxidoreductase [Candidatus Undinarchaeales archaeon SRR5007147.bin71]